MPSDQRKGMPTVANSERSGDRSTAAEPGSPLDSGRRDNLRLAVVEGCVSLADLYLEIEREYHPLEEEWHRALGA